MRGEGFNFVMGEVVIRWGRDVDDFQWAELIVGGIWCRWGGGSSWFRGCASPIPQVVDFRLGHRTSNIETRETVTDA